MTGRATLYLLHHSQGAGSFGAFPMDVLVKEASELAEGGVKKKLILVAQGNHGLQKKTFMVKSHCPAATQALQDTGISGSASVLLSEEVRMVD